MRGCGGAPLLSPVFFSIANLPERGPSRIMLKKAATLFATAALFCSTVALAQQQLKTTLKEDVYSAARESNLQGTVVKYSANSTTPPAGAQVELQTASGLINVHLGNARLLTASHLSLETGDTVTVVGENLLVPSGTVFAARVIQKGSLAVTLRSKSGVPLVMSPRNANVQQPAVGAR
jgi:hypothetical protein